MFLQILPLKRLVLLPQRFDFLLQSSFSFSNDRTRSPWRIDARPCCSVVRDNFFFGSSPSRMSDRWVVVRLRFRLEPSALLFVARLCGTRLGSWTDTATTFSCPCTTLGSVSDPKDTLAIWQQPKSSDGIITI